MSEGFGGWDRTFRGCLRPLRIPSCPPGLCSAVVETETHLHQGLEALRLGPQKAQVPGLLMPAQGLGEGSEWR